MSLDSAGRLMVNPVLRKFARLEKEVMMVGQGSHFELWDVGAWDPAAGEFDGCGSTWRYRRS